MFRRSASKRAGALVVVVATGGLFAAPHPVSACSVSPEVVDDVRVSDEGGSCLSVEETWDPGDYNLPTLRILNECPSPVDVRIEDCVPCYVHAADACFDCSEEWIQLRGSDDADGVRELVFQLGFPIDDHVGETVHSAIEWSRGGEWGALDLEIDLADKHPTQQADEACPGLCSLSTGSSPAGLAAVLLLLGVWARRRRGRIQPSWRS